MTPTGPHLSKTAKQRGREFKNASFYEDAGVLSCRVCAREVDLQRKQLLTSTSRATVIVRMQKQETLPSKKVARNRRKTVLGVQECQESKADCKRWNPQLPLARRGHIVVIFLDVLISANIPLEKADSPKLGTFLQTHIRYGGSVRGSDALRCRLSELFEKHETALKAMVQGTTVSIITDETTDNRSKSVVNLLFVESARYASGSLQLVLVEVKFVDEVNSSVIGRIVTRALTKYRVEFEDITGFVSDNAAYMVKSFNECIKPLCESAVHITCVAHTVNIIGSALQVFFPLVDKFFPCTKKAFWLSSRKRAFYKSHLEKCGIQCVKTPPAPVNSRWNSWIEAFEQHAAYFEYYPSLLR
ncbi:uncharacterized protein LOC142590468 [Dermacentor variabilis]|uniref:uncharacterized protein LOC142590468 n=1 Tax=Dermacentor variabilis TaxID=34621 RepID=UPI003F5B0A0F